MEDECVVEAVNLTKIYRSGKVEVVALKDVNLKVRKSEFISIVGPSGSGKSTLLHLLGGLDTPTRGEVYIEGINLAKLNSDERADLRKRKIGFIFQAYNLIPRMTALKNVELPLLLSNMGKRARRMLAIKMLEAVGLGDKIDRRPTELSGGEQQRVAIARALVTRPSIVLGDEITGNLDSKTAMEIVSLLRRLNEQFGTTFIIVTHNLEVARVADRTVYLRDGRVVKEVVNRREVV